MRVGLVVERFEPAGGGVEYAVWNVARELVRAGDEVHVYARRAQAAAGVQLHRLPVPEFWQPLRVGSFALQARRELERHPCDVVHSFSRTLYQDVFHAGGGSHADYMRQVYGKRGARLRRLSPRHALQLALERRIFSDSRSIIQCVSTMVRDEIAARFAIPFNRMPVIPYGVDLERFAPGPSAHARSALRSEWRAGDSPVWLFAGSGWRRKGLDTALAALADPRAAEHQLWVAGRDRTSPWRSLAEKLGVAERVHFLGLRADLERVLAACDGLLLPTRYDAFGMVCLEAAAAARPVIVSDRAGAAELLEGGGLIVPEAEDPRGFAAAMETLSEPEARERMGETAREISLQYDWSEQVARLRNLYRKISS